MPLLDFEILSQGGEAQLQPPPGRHLLRRPGLEAIGGSFETIRQRGHAAGEELRRAKVVIDIVEERYRKSGAVGRLSTIARLDGRQRLGLELRRWRQERQRLKLAVDPRRRADCT